jgi:excisionase family DNA binding protein
MEGDYYTTGEAARILGVTETRIRQLLIAGELEGVRDMNERWRIPQHAVHARKEQRRPIQDPPRVSADAREWIERAQELERELGRLEGRLELTEVAESTLRDQLERERKRADEERQRADEERDRAKRLEEELREAQRPWWRRVFGG